MTAIITFIGWHDSGKTTLASQVVSELKNLGYRIAVIKSTSEVGIQFDTPGTDTFKHKDAGASSVMLVAPDQVVLQTGNDDLSLTTLANRYFPDVDLVIGEGFKTAARVPKIEVFKDLDEKLRETVTGVVAVATNLEGVKADYVFRLDAARQIALFIEKRYLRTKGKREKVTLLVNGEKIPMKDFVQEALGGTVQGFVRTLKQATSIREIELRIKFDQ